MENRAAKKVAGKNSMVITEIVFIAPLSFLAALATARLASVSPLLIFVSSILACVSARAMRLNNYAS